MKPRLRARAAAVAAPLAVWAGCAANHMSDQLPAAGTQAPRIWLTDRLGERFDITHAVRHYGMRREGFEFGIGRNTIRPINQPDMLLPGEVGYPSTPFGLVGEVIGTTLGDEARSYPIRPLVRHEIVNDSFGNLQAAVAY